MKNDLSNRRIVIVTAVAASLLMLFSGVGYRVLAARLAAPATTSLLPPGTLDKLPLQIGDWAGEEAPLDEAVVAATDTDAHISRRYSRNNGLESVWFYVAFGVNARDLMPHRPEVCYTGNGWTIIDRSTLELPLSDGTKLPCNAFQFSRGALNNNKLIVLDYYIVDGEYCHDVSLLRSKAWRGSGTIGYVAQIQIVGAIADDVSTDSAGRTVKSFAIESAPSLTSLLEGAVANQNAVEGGLDTNNTFEGADSE